jgi:hypothetical protein
MAFFASCNCATGSLEMWQNQLHCKAEECLDGGGLSQTRFPIREEGFAKTAGQRGEAKSVLVILKSADGG